MKIAFLFHFSPYLLVVVHTAPHTFSRLLPKFLTASKSFLIFSCSKVAYAKLLFSKKTHLKILKTNKYLHINRVSRQFFFDSYFVYSNVCVCQKIVLIALVFIQSLKRFFSFDEVIVAGFIMVKIKLVLMAKTNCFDFECRQHIVLGRNKKYC